MTHRSVSLSILALLGSLALAPSSSRAAPTAADGAPTAERAERKAKKSSASKGRQPAARPSSGPSTGSSASAPASDGAAPALARPAAPSSSTGRAAPSSATGPSATNSRPSTVSPSAPNTRSQAASNAAPLNGSSAPAGATATTQRPSAPAAGKSTAPPSSRLNPASPAGLQSAREAAAAKANPAASASARPQGETAKVRTPDTRIGDAERSAGSNAQRPDSARSGGGGDSHARAGHVRPHRSGDHRYSRPHHRHVRQPAHVRYPPPRWAGYRPLYAHWYVHPYYRWTHATVAIAWLGFGVYAWTYDWVPPARAGFVWVPGYWSAGIWFPGYWTPIGPAPVVVNTSYVYVPGWWVSDVYVEGFYRPVVRDDGEWTWVDGYYLADGTYVWGHWVPNTPAPDGYVWVPGYWDGEQWLGGFWRPERRQDYVWVAPYYAEDGVFHSGYWEPKVALPGHVWIPGWFDGEQWIEGYWVTEQEYSSTDTSTWEAPEGWNDGWEETDEVEAEPLDDGSLPLAIPIGGQSRAGGETHAAPPPSGG